MPPIIMVISKHRVVRSKRKRQARVLKRRRKGQVLVRRSQLPQMRVLNQRRLRKLLMHLLPKPRRLQKLLKHLLPRQLKMLPKLKMLLLLQKLRRSL